MDDLVAELTLKLRNEMNAGLDEVRGEFGSLESTLQGLRDVLGDLTGELAAMRGPAQLGADFEAITGDVKGVIDAVGGIGAAAEAQIAKVDDLKTAFAGYGGSGPYSFENTFVPNPYGPSAEDNGAPAFIPPGTQLPEPDEDTDDPKRPQKDGAHGDAMTHLLYAGLELALGKESAETYAGFSSTLTQITNTEQLHGPTAADEQSRIAAMVDDLALKYSASSEDLVNAYKFLITTGLKPAEVDALMPSLAEAATAHAIDVTDMQGAVFALADSFKISPDQMGAALGQLGYATKLGHFSAESFGQFLPVIGGALATAGDTGPDVADYTYAAMETIIKNVSIPSEAATDDTDMIHYIGTTHAERSFLQMSRMLMPQMRAIFDKYGVKPADLYAMEDQAVAEGKDPIQTVLDFVHDATKNMTPTDRNAVISDYFTNQQGGDAVRSIMQHWDTYQTDYSTLRNIGQSQLNDDFNSANAAPQAGLNRFDESLSQFNREIGQILIPDFELLGAALRAFTAGLQTISGIFNNLVATPLGTALGTTAAYAAHEMNQYPNGAQRSRFGFNVPPVNPGNMLNQP
jgi:TP901 family phage tail tape measure protein